MLLEPVAPTLKRTGSDFIYKTYRDPTSCIKPTEIRLHLQNLRVSQFMYKTCRRGSDFMYIKPTEITLHV